MLFSKIYNELKHLYGLVLDQFQATYQYVAENPNILAVCFILALIPAIFWLWIYYRKITMDEGHRKLMVRTFLIGMLSIFPVFIFDYLMLRFFNFDLNFFIYDHTTNNQYHFLFLGFIIVGILEEMSKAFIVREVDFYRKEFDRIIDGIEFAAAAALGFAFSENVFYFVTSFSLLSVDATAFVQIVAVRSLSSMFAHTVFSGIFGYYYGKAKFCGVPTPAHLKKFAHIHMHLHKAAAIRYYRIKHLMQGKNIHFHKDFKNKLKEEELIAEGLMMAIILHAIYDFLLGIHLSYLIIPLILLEYGIIAHEFHVHRNLEEYKMETTWFRSAFFPWA